MMHCELCGYRTLFPIWMSNHANRAHHDKSKGWPFTVTNSSVSYEFWELSTYNAEKARGLVHTEEWKAKMAKEQERYNKEVLGPEAK